MPRDVFAAFASEPQETILRAALEAHGVAVNGLPLGAHLETAIQQAMRAAEPPLLIIDLAVLAQLHGSAAAFCAWKGRACAPADLLLYCSGQYAVQTPARAWAQAMGARDLLPGCDLVHCGESLRPALDTILALLGAGPADWPAAEVALQALPAGLDQSTQVAQAWQHVDVLRSHGFEAAELVALMRGAQGVEIRARRYRAKTYDECFVGTDCVNWLMRTAQIGRDDALRVGQALFALGYIYHVVREQPFRDGHFYYRLRAQSPRIDALDLRAVVDQLRSAVPIRDRKYRGHSYQQCFVGAAAVSWMRQTWALSQNEALTLGERLLELFVIHHVLEEHHFRDGTFFYRFCEDEA